MGNLLGEWIKSMSIIAPAKSAKKAYWQASILIFLAMIFISSTFLIEYYMPKDWLDRFWFPKLFPLFEYLPMFPFYLAPTTIIGLFFLITGAIWFLSLSGVVKR